MDSSGNAYVVSVPGTAVSKIPAGCMSPSCITTLGGGLVAPESIAIDGSGNLYIANTGNSVIDEIPTGCTTTSCMVVLGGNFSSPEGVAVDGSGNVYVADSIMTVISEIPAGCTATKFAGSLCTVTTLEGGLNSPFGVAVDGSGNVYVADSNNALIKEFPAGCTAADYTATTCSATTLGGGFTSPVGIAVDSSNNVYVTDITNKNVVKIPAGCTAADYTAATCVEATLGSGFNQPNGVTVDSKGYIYVADALNSAVEKISLGAVDFNEVAVGMSTSPGITLPFYFTTGGTIGTPVVLTLGASGKDFADAGTGTCTTNGTSNSYSVGSYCTVNVTFTPKDPGLRSGAVQLVNNSGAVLATVFVYGTGAGPLLATQQGTANVVNVGTPGGTPLGYPAGTAVDGAGDLYIADHSNNRIVEYSAGGVASVVPVGTPGGIGLSGPTSVAVDGAGNLYIADTSNNRIVEYSAAGVASVVNVGLLGGTALSGPEGVVVDGAGDLYIADNTNKRIVEWSQTQLPSLAFAATSVGSVSSNSPQSVTVQNIGNAALNVSALAASTNFNLNGSNTTCTSTTSLAAGDTCVLGIEFQPTATGALAGTVTLTDNNLNGTNAQQVIHTSGTVVQIGITPAAGALPGGTVGTAYSVTFAASGGTAPYIYSYSSSGTLLAGLALNSTTGVLSGTPTAVGSSSFSITATDSNSISNTQSYTLAIAQASTTTTLKASAATITAGASETLTATVASSGGTPTGTVTFLNGTTVLGTGTLASGVATLTSTTLPVGADSITASYAASGNFAASTSTATVVTVTAATAAAQGFTLAVSPDAVTVDQGLIGTTTVTLTPTSGYAGKITLSCSGMPASSSCTFSPTATSFTGSGNTPATVTLSLATFSLPTKTASLRQGSPLPWQSDPMPLLAGAFWLPGLLAAGVGLRKKLPARTLHLLLLLTLLTSLGILSGCAATWNL